MIFNADGRGQYRKLPVPCRRKPLFGYEMPQTNIKYTDMVTKEKFGKIISARENGLLFVFCVTMTGHSICTLAIDSLYIKRNWLVYITDVHQRYDKYGLACILPALVYNYYFWYNLAVL